MAKKNPFLVPARRKKPKKTPAKASSQTPPSAPSVSDINSQVIAEAKAIALAQPVTMKLCRLCETKDGPFLNIFETEQAIAKKIDALLPFTISEYDDLPHKICFRCSAKVEELHDFVERCTKAQQNLRKVLGKKPKVPPKSNTRQLWEEKLNKSNITNEDICNAVIQKAMEGIKSLPLNPIPVDEIPKNNSKSSIKAAEDYEKSDESDSSESETIPPIKSNEKPVTRTSRQKNSESTADAQKPDSAANLPSAASNKRVTKASKVPAKETPKAAKKIEESKHIELSSDIDEEACDRNESDSDESVNIPIKSIKEQKREPVDQKTENKSKPFNIMDHVSIIKVNGVGVLFQCKLCNRNFLKKDVVETHGCSKTGVPKPDFITPVLNVEPPKNPMASVKYINNKANIEPPKKIPEPVEIPPPPPTPEVKPKHKAGPASKTKKLSNEPSNFVGMKVKPRAVTPPPAPTPVATPPPPPPQTAPSIEVPAIPGMKSRYRLVPGPNNTFTLVEEPLPEPAPELTAKLQPQPSKRPMVAEQPKKADVDPKNIPIPKKIKITKNSNTTLRPVTLSSSVIAIDDEPVTDAPYPVGFFTSPTKVPTSIPVASKPESHAPVTFTTPAMKKQSYTVVQTGNPSKLLISAKPRPQPAEEATRPNKGKRRARHEEKTEQDKPYNVTIEDTAPAKDGFFTFISLDPLLQPSYVLPTENIIQESQISTSTSSFAGSSKSKDLYECSLCPEKFSREKKMLAHLQSHYNKMDEDHDEIVRPSKKRVRKS